MNVTVSQGFARLTGLPDPKQTARHKILALEATMRPLEQVECPVFHHFAPGTYARECHLPEGSVVVGKIHKHAHVNVVSKDG